MAVSSISCASSSGSDLSARTISVSGVGTQWSSASSSRIVASLSLASGKSGLPASAFMRRSALARSFSATLRSLALRSARRSRPFVRTVMMSLAASSRVSPTVSLVIARPIFTSLSAVEIAFVMAAA